MGIVHTHRGRLAPALILAVLMALAVVVTLGLAASPASAQSTYTTCAGCHSSAKHTSNSTHAGLFSSNGCATCHTAGSGAAGVRPAGCASCHNVTTVLGKPTHTSLNCGTTPGCHGFTSPTPTPTPTATAVATTMTLKVAPTIVRLNRTVKATGTAGPLASLAGAKVALKIERKVGTRWVKMKAVTKTVSAAGAFSHTYKAVKKGSHRVTASIAKTSTFTAKKLVKTFRVR
jgi:hypothetical protein